MVFCKSREKFIPYLHPCTPANRTSIKLTCISFSKSDFLSLYRTSLPLCSKNIRSFYSVNFLYLKPWSRFIILTYHRLSYFLIKAINVPTPTTIKRHYLPPLPCKTNLPMRTHFNLAYVWTSTSKNTTMDSNTHTCPQTYTHTHIRTKTIRSQLMYVRTSSTKNAPTLRKL